MECRPGYKRVRLCIREDLFRALVIIEASESLKRYKIIEDALLMYLEGRNKHALGGFRVLTVSEDLYRELVSIGGGSVEAGLRLLLEAYHNHQLGDQAQPQAWAQARTQVQANSQSQVQTQQSGEDEDELGLFEDNPWVGIIKSRGTRPN